MQHYDELILELYVLDAPEVQSRKDEITLHLKECAGCRSIIGELQGFYERMAESKPSKESTVEFSATNLIPISGRDRRSLVKRRTRELERLFQSAPAVRSATFVGRARYLFMHHPVVATTSSIALVAVMALAINFTATTMFKDKNPSYSILNTSSGDLEVYDGKNKLLWDVPVREISSQDKVQKSSNNSLTVICDMNGDGNKEVLTVVRYLGRDNQRQNLLNIFSGSGSLLKQVGFGRPVVYDGKQYTSNYATAGLVVDDFAGTGQKNIIVTAVNDHSPCVVSRLDASGNALGEYWHYGYVLNAYTIGPNNSTRKRLILTGIEDVDDPSYPVIVVLDPARITGATESGVSPGFGFQRSVAETYYIRLARTDLSDVLDLDCSVERMDTIHYGGQPAMRFHCSSHDPDKEIAFEYIFSIDMHLLEIKPSEAVIRLHDELMNRGKLKGHIDKQYLDSLADGIRYWDGMAWNQDYVQIAHISM